MTQTWCHFRIKTKNIYIEFNKDMVTYLCLYSSPAGTHYAMPRDNALSFGLRTEFDASSSELRTEFDVQIVTILTRFTFFKISKTNSK